MPIVKINKKNYINTDKLIRLSYENVVDKDGNELEAKAWYIYFEGGKIKTGNRFRINDFIKESRCRSSK